MKGSAPAVAVERTSGNLDAYGACPTRLRGSVDLPHALLLPTRLCEFGQLSAAGRLHRGFRFGATAIATQAVGGWVDRGEANQA